MYTEFYNLKEKPFNLVPNPSYLYLSSKHANALTFLEYGLTEKIGFIMLTGEIGIGKTTLVRHLLNQIESEVDVAVIFNTNVVSNDLINLILTEFEIEFEDGLTKGKALALLYDFLIEKYAEDRNVLLIIDEAQNLNGEVLEEIRMLSNLQTDDEMLLQIMIVGQPQLRDKLTDPALEQFAQRISVSYHLSSMTLEETGDYIAHRLDKVGGSGDLFTAEAVEKIFEVSKGIPRTINLLCDAALVYGFADEKTTLDLSIIEQVVEEKGGIGVFTKDKIKKETGNEPDKLNGHQNLHSELSDKISNLENSFEQLKEYYHKHIMEIESRAEFCRDEMVGQLKTSLAAEQEKSEKLLYEYGRLKERYRLLLKKFKSPPN